MTAAELVALQSMTIPQIRRAQDIVRAQLPLAHAKGNTKALVKLQEWEQDYINELLRRPDMASYDIVAYTYQADIYCDLCIARIAADHARPDDIVVPLLHNTESLLNEWAEREGIDREDEATFDSGDFPKVVFEDMLEGEEYCGHCHEPIGD